MNYNHLHEIIKNVRGSITCPKCKKDYDDHGIEIVDILGNRGILIASCSHCTTSILVTTSIQEYRANLNLPTKNALNEYTLDLNQEKITEINKRKEIKRPAIPHKIASLPPKISANEVIQMHQFLQKFEGDISKHF